RPMDGQELVGRLNTRALLTPARSPAAWNRRLRLHGFWWCEGKREHECRSDALGGLDFDPTVHRPHAVFDNRQPQAQAADMHELVALRVCACESLEDPGD